MSERLYPHWVTAALCMAVFLALMIPALAISWPPAVLMIFLQAPLYMLHQVEEHTGDRFRAFVNGRAYHGREALTPQAVLWINIPGVWGITLLSLYAAEFAGPGWGLAAVYLVLVNGVIHVVTALVQRAYNPGLWTAVIAFLPAGGTALWIVSALPAVHGAQHAVGLGIALAIHVAIIVHVQARVRMMAA